MCAPQGRTRGSTLTKESLFDGNLVLGGGVACIQPDGSLSRSGELILLALHTPATPEEMVRETGFDLFLIRAALREYLQAGYVEKADDRYRLTPKGEAALEGTDLKMDNANSPSAGIKQ